MFEDFKDKIFNKLETLELNITAGEDNPAACTRIAEAICGVQVI